MGNRLKAMGKSAAWNLMVGAAVKAAQELGYVLERQPGRGLSNTYLMTKDGVTKKVSLRTTGDRWIAFPPLANGTRWKTLDDVDMVLVSAVDDYQDPNEIYIYMFPADEVRRRFNASYAARIENGHTVRDNFGMWVTLDRGDDKVPTQVGHSLAIDYPPIASFKLGELQKLNNRIPILAPEESRVVSEQRHESTTVEIGASLKSVADVLTFARDMIASLTGMPADAINLDLKIGVSI